MTSRLARARRDRRARRGRDGAAVGAQARRPGDGRSHRGPAVHDGRAAAVRRLGSGAGAPRRAVGGRPPRRLAAVGPRPAPALGRAATSTSRGCIEGNVALQVFAASTKSPRHLNIERNDDRSDDVVLLALALGWPPATWRRLLPRALHLAARADAMAARSDGSPRASSARGRTSPPTRPPGASDPAITAGLLAIEGAHALDDDPANVEVVADAGFRMMSPSHFFDNAFGGSAHGIDKGGLTEAGPRDGPADGGARDAGRRRRTPRRPRSTTSWPWPPGRSSPRTPGVRGVADNARNLTDAQLRGIAATGGLRRHRVLADGLRRRRRRLRSRARSATRSTSPASSTSALGSDFDGAVPEPFDATGLVLLTEALLDAGLDDDAIAQGHGRQRAAPARPTTLPGLRSSGAMSAAARAAPSVSTGR